MPSSFDKLGGMTISEETSAPSPEPEAENSVSPAPKKKVPAAKAAPKSDPEPERNPYSKKVHVVSGSFTDTVATSALVRNPNARKSLSVHHLQRRLAELGYPEAAADRDGYLGELTERSVRAWQEDHGYFGTLTAEQVHAIFDNDANVTVFVDTME